MSHRTRDLLRRFAALALGLVILAVIARTVDWAQAGQVLEGASVGGLLLAGIFYLPPWILRGWRWRLLARDLDEEVPLGPAVAMATVGNMLNLVLPAKAGDLLWANAANARFGTRWLPAVVSVLAGRVFDLGVLMSLAAAALLFVPEARFAAAAGPMLAALGLGTGLGLVLFVRLRLGRLLLIGPLRRFLPLHDRLVGAAAAITGARALARQVGLTALIWVNEGLVAWLVAGALGLSIGPAAILVAIGVANLSKIVPLTPASFGTYEAAGALAVQSLAGVEYSAAFAALLAEHLLKNGVNLLLGLVALGVAEVPVLRVDLERVRGAWRAALRGE